MMKKFLSFVISLKSFAAMIFTGMICLYMVTGVLYGIIMDKSFNYTVPFVFILQGLILSVLISVLWAVIFSDMLIKKWRYLPRLLVFSLILMILLSVCFLVFFAIPENWAKLWLGVTGCVSVGIIALSVINEFYFKTAGKRYTEILKNYKENLH